MTAWVWAVLAIGGTFGAAALGDLISEEIRGWLDLAPKAVLRLAAAQLSGDQRETIYRDEWLPELAYILRGAESRPITRLVRGTTYAVGLLIAARRIAHHLNRTLIPQPAARATGPVLVDKFGVPEEVRDELFQYLGNKSLGRIEEFTLQTGEWLVKVHGLRDRNTYEVALIMRRQ
jgi:hypothetical protein